MKLIRDVIHTFASLFKGLRVTFVNWKLRPGVTELYPEQKTKLPERFRGMPTLPRDPSTGFCRCIGCGACARVCPENIITVTQDKTDPKNRKPAEFTIDMSRCMFCGFCMEVCPVKCLKPAKTFEMTCRSRKDMIYDLERLMDKGGEFPMETVAAGVDGGPEPPGKGESE